MVHKASPQNTGRLPRWLTQVLPADRRRGDGAEFITFAEGLCRVTKDSVGGSAGSPMVLRDWQKEILTRLLARTRTGRLRHRQALIGMPRKNGKSALGASLALYELVFGPSGGEVYSIAADKEQARIVFGTARRMVDLEPHLLKSLKLFRDAIEFPTTGSVYRVLSAEAFTKEGLNPHFVVADEVHAQPNRDLWDTLSLASGARQEPMMLGITTAGVRVDSTGRDSLCYGMYQYGKKVVSGEIDDPSFFFAWWEPLRDGADHRDEATWRQTNPGLGDIVSIEDFRSSILRTPENEFRTKRLNQFVSTARAWMPSGAWEACADPAQSIPVGADVCLGFDGSYNNDSTALVVATCVTDAQPTPHLDVVECWERPTEAGQDWTVPILAVEDAIRAACRRWQVREIVCDPARWARTYAVLEDEGLPVVEFPQSPARMVPATQRFYESVVNRTVTHSGDPRLARHVANCTVRTDNRGSRISKESKSSARKIDLAVASVMALERASQPPPAPATVAFIAWDDL